MIVKTKGHIVDSCWAFTSMTITKNMCIGLRIAKQRYQNTSKTLKERPSERKKRKTNQITNNDARPPLNLNSFSNSC